jgi:hypothetical protein
MRIERTEHHLWIALGWPKVRQIHIVKEPWFNWPAQQNDEHPSDPIRRTLPIEFHPSLAIMRHRHARPAVQHRLPHRRHSSRVVDVGAEVPAVVNSAQYPIRVRNKS